MNHRFKAPQALLFCAVLAGMTSAFASPPVSIEFEAPFANDGQPLLDESGWELLIELTIREDEYIGFFVEPDFPTNSDNGWLVFDDPDECFSHWGQEPPPECFFDLYGGDPGAIPDDETYIEFHTGINQAGAEPNNFAKPDLTALLTNSAGAGSPFFEQFTGGEPLPIVPTGPYTGADVEDGYGFGTDFLENKVNGNGDGNVEMYIFQCLVKVFLPVYSKPVYLFLILASDSIASLQGYIDDIEGGKIEFTNERASLEKETKALQDEIDKAELTVGTST